MIRKLLNTRLNDTQKEFIQLDSSLTQRMLKQLENNIINNMPELGLPHWSKQSPLLVKNFTFLMTKLGYGKTDISSKFAKFNFNLGVLNKEELEQFRELSKFDKFTMQCNLDWNADDLVRVNGKNIKTGLKRPGFAKVAKNQFKYDTKKLKQYLRPIKQNLIKSIKKAIENGSITDKFFADKANYRLLVDYCTEVYLQDGIYNLEYNISDQRGRSIFNALKRIGNPISSKDFRALLVVPEEQAIVLTKDDTNALNDIYYFIAELVGSKADTEKDKIKDGKKFYKKRTLPRLNLKDEEARKDLYELIWLERIYDKLDNLNNRFIKSIVWDIPLEIDASMSIAQVVGALTNDYRLLESTNVIGDTLSDPWYIKDVRRLCAKAVGTPTFYGSSQSAIKLIRDKGIEVDKDEIKRIKKEFGSGRFSIMKQFKDLLIQNYNVHMPITPITTWGETFDIHINKFKKAGTTPVVTEAWDGSKFRKAYTREPNLVPDYKRMKLFWATGLVHNLDSKIMDNIANMYSHWMLTIHDAIIALPRHCKVLRKEYSRQLKLLNNDRFKVMANYRQSIGATTIKADIAFMKLLKDVVDAGDIDFKSTAMK